MSSRDSASAITWSRGRLSRLNASRDAVFSPIPGSRDNSFTSRVIAGGSPSWRFKFSVINRALSFRAETGELQPSERTDLAHLVGEHFLRAAASVVHRDDDQILEHRLV